MSSGLAGLPKKGALPGRRLSVSRNLLTPQEQSPDSARPQMPKHQNKKTHNTVGQAPAIQWFRIPHLHLEN